MKAEMSAQGVLVVSPETPLEAYALGQWANAAVVFSNDDSEPESCFFRGSMFLVARGILPEAA